MSTKLPLHSRYHRNHALWVRVQAGTSSGKQEPCIDRGLLRFFRRRIDRTKHGQKSSHGEGPVDSGSEKREPVDKRSKMFVIWCGVPEWTSDPEQKRHRVRVGTSQTSHNEFSHCDGSRPCPTPTLDHKMRKRGHRRVAISPAKASAFVWFRGSQALHFKPAGAKLVARIRLNERKAIFGTEFA
jgi:hypothetical protein